MIEALAIEWDKHPSYILDVALMDWALGCLSVAVTTDVLEIKALTEIDTGSLAELGFDLQSGVAFFQSAWPLDELARLRHEENVPDQLTFEPQEAHLQLCGSRGRFSIQRLDAGSFAFRMSLAARETLGTAANEALKTDPDFDLAFTLASLFSEGLVIHKSRETIHAQEH